MSCTTFRADENTPEVGMAGMETDKGGMESPVVPTDVTGMKILMECDIYDIPVLIHGRTVCLNLFLDCGYYRFFSSFQGAMTKKVVYIGKKGIRTENGELSIIHTGLYIMPEPSDGIGPASLAVPHLLDVFCTLILHLSLHLRGGRGDIGKFVLGNQGDDVEGIHSHIAHFLCNLRDMLFVDTRDIDRINLDDHVTLDRHLDPFQLVLKEYFCTFKTGIPLPLVIDKLVDLRPYLRINRIQRYRDITYVVFLKEIYFIGEQEAICTDTLDNVREFLVKPAEGFKSTFVGKRLSRPGDADDLDIIELLHHLPYHIDCLVRIQDLCGDSRTALVHTIEVPDTIVALDIAFRSNRDMASPERMASLLRKTRVFLDPAQLFRIPFYLPAGNLSFSVSVVSHSAH